jgi:hypothetical protein
MTPLQQIPPKSRQETILYSISGLDINTDSELVGTERMAELVNFDLHESDGIATRRPSRSTLYTLDDAVTMITDFEGSLYAGTRAGTLYQDGNSFDTGYGENITARSYSDPDDVSVLYLASQEKMQKIREGVLSTWGIDAPTGAPFVGSTAGSAAYSSGTYSIIYTYVQKNGSTVVQESNPSPPRTKVISGTTFNTLDITITGSTNASVTHIRTYRSDDGGAYLFDEEIANPDSGSINYESIKATSALGAQVSQDNDIPPMTDRFAVWQDRGWLADDINLYYSKKFNLNAWPALNFLPIGTSRDPITALVASTNGLGLFTQRRRYRIMEALEDINAIGDTLPFFGGASNTFIPVLASQSRGTPGLQSAANVEDGVLYASNDGVFITDLAQQDVEISGAVRGLFNGMSTDNIKFVDGVESDSIVLSEHNAKIYMAYQQSGGTSNDQLLVFSKRNSKWYSYDLSCTSFYSSYTFNRIYAGSPTGEVFILDDYQSGVSSSVSARLRTHDLSFGLPFARKILNYLYVDSDLISGETMTGTLYVDGVLHSTFTVSNSLKIRFPNVYGRTFAVDLLYSGASRLKIRGLRFVWTPL